MRIPRILLVLLSTIALTTCAGYQKAIDKLDYNITFSSIHEHMALHSYQTTTADEACKNFTGDKLNPCSIQRVEISNAVPDNPQIVKVTMLSSLKNAHAHVDVKWNPPIAKLEAVGVGKPNIAIVAKKPFKTESKKYEIVVHQPTKISLETPKCTNPVRSQPLIKEFSFTRTGIF